MTLESKTDSHPPRSFPARLHVLLASAATVGLVLRRGPAKQVATLLWDRKTDQFTLGQWLKGRIYERRCDLSPDGTYFIYFAMNGRWRGEAKGSWTAVSRAPYLKALVLYPKGDCWNGGGLWTGRRQYWLNGGCYYAPLHQTSEIERDEAFQPTDYFGGECPSVYYPRLMRDGWTLANREKQPSGQSATIFEKPIGKGWQLRKIAHAQIGPPPGKGCYWDEHELINLKTDEWLAYPDWEWAEVDGNSLVWATGGKLFRGRLGKTALFDEREIYDFNDMQFEPIEAPY